MASRAKTVRTTRGTKPQKNGDDGTDLSMCDRTIRPVSVGDLEVRVWVAGAEGDLQIQMIDLNRDKRAERDVRSALRNFSFFVLVVLAASRTELLDDELFRHGPLVLGRVIIGSAALGARHLDRVAHGYLLEGLHVSATTAGREEGGTVRDFYPLSMTDVIHVKGLP